MFLFQTLTIVLSVNVESRHKADDKNNCDEDADDDRDNRVFLFCQQTTRNKTKQVRKDSTLTTRHYTDTLSAADSTCIFTCPYIVNLSLIIY